MTEPKLHPIAEAFPAMSTEDYEALREDIRKNGQLDPIVRLDDGRIVDGVHRLKACLEVGWEPRFVEIDDEDAVIFAVSHNLKRRHLTESQRAWVGAKLLPYERTQAKGRQQKHGNTAPGRKKNTSGKSTGSVGGDVRDKVAAQVGVSGKLIDMAAKVGSKGSAPLQRAVADGRVRVSDAAALAGKPEEEEALALVEKRQAKTLRQAARQIKLEEQAEKVEAAPPPEGEFEVILADPPWKFNKTRDKDPTQRGRTPYPTMTVEEICAYPVPAAESCILWLWCTNAHLADGSVARVLDAWGFTGKTVLTWAKPKMGLGDWLRGRTEHCVVAARGKPLHKPPGGHTTLLQAPVAEHSVKPAQLYELIEDLCPGRKVELFARRTRPGWAAYGAEVEAAQ